MNDNKDMKLIADVTQSGSGGWNVKDLVDLVWFHILDSKIQPLQAIINTKSSLADNLPLDITHPLRYSLSDVIDLFT